MQEQQVYIANLQRAISSARFDAYHRADDMDSIDTVARYLWNIALSEALYPSLQALEITLRNSLHTALSTYFGNDFWFDQHPHFLRQAELDKVANAKQELRQQHKPVEAGRVVAELSFGFWTSLLDKYYENTHILWPALLATTFPAMPRRIRTRTELSKRFNRIRRLRNRTSHHESILNWKAPSLEQEHKEIGAAIRWMSPAMHGTVVLIDRFPSVYAQTTSFYRNIVVQYLGT